MGTEIASQTGDEQAQQQLYRPFVCRVEFVKDLTPAEKLFRLVRVDGQPFGQRPGQFMQVSLIGIGEAPISVSSSMPAMTSRFGL